MVEQKIYICPHCGAREDVYMKKADSQERDLNWKETVCHACGKPYKRSEAKTTTPSAEVERKLKR